MPDSHLWDRKGAYLKLICSPPHTLPVLAVDYIYQPVCVVEVVSPQWPQLFLAAYVPNSEEHILVLHFLHVETCRTAGGASVDKREVQHDAVSEPKRSELKRCTAAENMHVEIDDAAGFARPWRGSRD